MVEFGLTLLLLLMFAAAVVEEMNLEKFIFLGLWVVIVVVTI